jgi:hypothetical protein
MNQIEMKEIKNNIKVRGAFIDLMEYLEKINIDYSDINQFVGFIYMEPKNEYRYKISEVVNEAEVYTFKYLKEHTFEPIPNATFNPTTLYDFDIDFINKTFKKIDEYKIIDHIMINIDKPELIYNKKNKSLIRKIFGC